MKFGKFLVLLLVAVFFTAGNCFAFGKVANSDTILDDMYVNPSKYIKYGGASTGLSFLIDKTSVKSDKYAPPEYIITARTITHYNSGRNDKYEQIEKDGIVRYRYNYNSRQMWVETLDENNNLYWKEIDPAKSKNYHDDNWVSLGEILFFLNYDINFYGEIKSYIAKRYIEKGLSGLPMTKLDNGGDNMIWHFYNHKTNKIEWWKIFTNPETKNPELKRVK